MLITTDKTEKKIVSINEYNFYYTDKNELRHTDSAFVMENKFLTEEFFTKTLQADYDNGKKRLCLAEDGTTVARFLERIPTFDSSDRMYDSYKVLLIYEQKGIKKGILLRGGYYLASAVEYNGLVCADEKTNEAMEELISAYTAPKR